MVKLLLESSVLIASDHAGLELKEYLKSQFAGRLNFIDLGTNSKDSVDYTDYADALASRLNSAKGPEKFGVLICGSGVGICMRANRYPKVRAVQAWSEEIAKLSREHNNANVICFGERVQEKIACVKMLEVFLKTSFLGEINAEGASPAAARHAGRVKKLETPIR